MGVRETLGIKAPVPLVGDGPAEAIVAALAARARIAAPGFDKDIVLFHDLELASSNIAGETGSERHLTLTGLPCRLLFAPFPFYPFSAPYWLRTRRKLGRASCIDRVCLYV